MPATKRRLPNGNYQVRTPNGIHAKNTTKAKAEAQERLLNAVEYSDWRPTGKKKKGYGIGKKK